MYIHVDKKSLCTRWLQYKNAQKYFKQFQSLAMIMYLELELSDGANMSLVSIKFWRLGGGDILNTTCNFLYCNIQVLREILITLYLYRGLCECYNIYFLLKIYARYILLVPRTCYILSPDFNVNTVFKYILCPSSEKSVLRVKCVLSNVMKSMVLLVSKINFDITFCENIKIITSVLSNFTCCAVVFDTLYYTATNNACQLHEHVGICLLFCQVLNIISKRFLHFKSASISRMSHFKYFNFVQRYQVELKLPASLIYYHY
jgi:hypothetical protein